MVCSFASDALAMNWSELELIFEYRSSLFLCTDVNLLILTAASIVSSAPGHVCTQNRETECQNIRSMCFDSFSTVADNMNGGLNTCSLNLVECCC